MYVRQIMECVDGPYVVMTAFQGQAVFPNVHGMLTAYRLEDSICSLLTDLYRKHETTMNYADSYHSKRQVPSCLVLFGG